MALLQILTGLATTDICADAYGAEELKFLRERGLQSERLLTISSMTRLGG